MAGYTRREVAKSGTRSASSKCELNTYNFNYTPGILKQFQMMKTSMGGRIPDKMK